MTEPRRLNDLAFDYLEPLEEDEADEIEYLMKHNRELRDLALRLEDIVKGTYNRRLLTQNHTMRGNIVGLEMKLETANQIRQRTAEIAIKHLKLRAERIAILKAELNAANEALLDQAGSNDLLVVEMAMVYNGDLVLGEGEISAEEMSVYAADKITIPITAEA